jgi:glycosyltransferase involved in cell wall biosynthesis
MEVREKLCVLHVVPSLDPVEGGPSVAVPLLAKAVARRGHRIVIVTTIRGGTPPQVEGRKEKVESSSSTEPKIIFVRRSTEFYKVSWELVRWLRANIRNFDLVHIHALFSFSSTAAAFIAAKNNIPYIVRPLGVLNRWGLENRRAILKRGSLALIERRILSRAAAIHYTSDAERSEAAKIGRWVARLPSFVCPLPVHVPTAARVISYQLSVNRGAEESEEPATSASGRTRRGEAGSSHANTEGFLAKFPQAKGKRIVLFLSRIDPKKGIELLLDAVALVRSEFHDLALVIAGSGDSRYEARLRDRADRLGLGGDVIWTGFLSGEEKAAALAAAEIFVLPSYSENFGIAAAEAFAAGKASVVSDQVGLAENARHANAAIVVPCDANALAAAIKSVLSDPAQQQALGEAARRFAGAYFSLEAVGKQLEERYRAVAGAGMQTSNIQRPTSNAQ